MSEADYVRAIRAAATAYLEVIRDPTGYPDDGTQRIRRWWTIRDKLSAHTAVDLCDAWLAQSRRQAPGRAEQQVEGKE